MAAIAPDGSRRRFLRSAMAATVAMPAFARQWRDVRATITYAGSALANGNPSDALTVFTKNCPGYEKLVDYFSALTSGYEIASEVEITDETPDKQGTEVEATWSLTLTSLSTSAIERRSDQVKMRLQPDKPGKESNWKIVSFSPVELFNPQPRNG